MRSDEIRLTDTICALATPYAAGAIHVIRVSGDGAYAAVGAICAKPIAKKGFVVQRNQIVDGAAGRVVDDVLLLTFVGPRSYTGQDLVEIDCHGSVQIAEAICSLLARRGVRFAEPGEFTRRAFLNGKMTLSQAAAVDLVVKAKSPQVRELAVSALTAGDGRLEAAQDKLVSLIGGLEVSIDYPDTLEGQNNVRAAAAKAAEVRGEIAFALTEAKKARRAEAGIKVAIVGRPNVGKSSLLNVLSGRRRALVSPVPGTTRDVIEANLTVRGFALTLLDTAGIRRHRSGLEGQGVALARKTLKEADLIVFVRAPGSRGQAEDARLLAQIKKTKKPYVTCVNKSDLLNGQGKSAYPGACFTCAKDGDAAELEEAVAAKLSAWRIDAGSRYVLTAQWQTDLLADALRALDEFAAACDTAPYPEILVEPLKRANDDLLKVLGKRADFDLMDEIFKRFCLGK